MENRETVRSVEIYDTTLRDGAQGRGISFSLADKLRIFSELDQLGLSFIEGGYPSSNEKDQQFFEALKKKGFSGAVPVAFGMTCRKGLIPEEDENLQFLLRAGTNVVTLVGKGRKLDVEKVLCVNLKENLRLIEGSCAFFKKRGLTVFFDAEHFFDGFKSDEDYALLTLAAAVNGGADKIILCDTNGGSLPSEVGQIIDQVKEVIDTPLGIHAHNDAGLAVANSLTAVEHGVVQIQGTINGYGERCGNTNLCSLVPTLLHKMKIGCISAFQMACLTETSRLIAEIANLRHDASQPYVGTNAFVHKAGLHWDGERKVDGCYQHFNPGLVGNRSQAVVSELSGKAHIQAKAREFGLELSLPRIKTVLAELKRLENDGLQFDGADGSVELLMLRSQDGYSPPFETLAFRTQVENWSDRLGHEANVRIKVGEEERHEISGGNGPVNALDRAMRKALRPFFPKLDKIHLADFKVRILKNGKRGTSSLIRVLIDFSCEENFWTIVGCSTDIIQASFQALRDGIEYAIIKKFV